VACTLAFALKTQGNNVCIPKEDADQHKLKTSSPSAPAAIFHCHCKGTCSFC